ncbi:ketopantoate reductase family protein [uncultured Hoeflea sp.]|uniref:ketopantoate reductase family protein n=1 Tax=uncultured Hoeflea sp. TaxID=538666 RepID=UPI0030EE0139|tara:strand:- start:150001 stop:150915 length:915 start_codon:yes stop_codon:yes gene_type:complete
MKIAILGAGALGSVIGGLMAEQGIDVCLLDVNQAHIDAINRSGLQLDTPEGTRRIAISALRPEQCPGDVELIILLTKIFHTEAALTAVQPVIDAGARVLTIQNGLGNAERVARRVPEAQILMGSTMIPGGYLGPGHVSSAAQSWTVFKPILDAQIAEAEAIAKVLAPVGFRYSADAEAQIWQKAAFNCAMNATCGLIGARVAAISADPQGKGLVRAIADEVIAVAQAKGLAVERDAVYQHLDVALAEHTAHKPSMLQDLEAGRETEIEALCGEVARQAAALKLAAPLNTALATLVGMKSRAASA